MDNQLSNIASNLIGLKKKQTSEASLNALNQIQMQQSQQSQSQLTDHPAVLKAATNLAAQAGADPGDLVIAKQQLGNKDFIGLCERFVEQVTKGATGLFSSASSAFNGQQGQSQTDLSKMKPGDSIYFAADQSNGGNGHTGIYSGNNKFISATDNGVQENDLSQWQKSTGQKILGYIPQGTKS